jgi:L-amino acid N-acyltransferase YncA
MLDIRIAKDEDFEAIWPIFHEIVQAGETYAYDPATTKEEAYQIWMKAPRATYVAFYNGEVVGTYYIKPNQPSLGAHVCNAGYMVGSNARGLHVWSTMCLHSQEEARKLGFLAMQFNCVVSTNQIAIQLWQKLGFDVVGTLPKAFNHKRLGFVDALVMYKILDDRLKENT